MNATALNRSATSTTTGRRVIGMRLIVTSTTVALIVAAVVSVGAVSERNTRRALTAEIETRLLLEARNLALTGAGALLSEFPELTLAPLVKEMQTERPELAFVVVVDHRGAIQGHADPRRLGEPYRLPDGLVPVTPAPGLGPGERLLGNAQVLVAEVPISHPSRPTLGRAIVAVHRTYVEASVAAARRQQVMFLVGLLVVGVALALVVMTILLRPIGALRAGLERVGQGDLDTPVRLRDHTELGLLADAVNDMAARLRAAQRQMLDANRRLQDANQHLSEMDRLKSEFLQNINHELRTPIAIIIGYLSNMADHSDLSPQDRRAIEILLEQSERLTGLVQNLLAFSESSRDAAHVEIADLEVATLLGSYAENRRATMVQQRRELDLAIDPSVPLARADGQGVVQILDALVDNAIKFTPSGSRVRLHAGAESDATQRWVRIDVEDEGPGIPPEHLAVIFEPFRQGDGSSTRTVGGLGLGLALAQQLAKGMGGRLEVESEVGRGTTFHLMLKAA